MSESQRGRVNASFRCRITVSWKQTPRSTPTRLLYNKIKQFYFRFICLRMVNESSRLTSSFILCLIYTDRLLYICVCGTYIYFNAIDCSHDYLKSWLLHW